MHWRLKMGGIVWCLYTEHDQIVAFCNEITFRKSFTTHPLTLSFPQNSKKEHKSVLLQAGGSGHSCNPRQTVFCWCSFATLGSVPAVTSPYDAAAVFLQASILLPQCTGKSCGD